MDTKPIQILLDTNCLNSKGRLQAITELEAMKAHGVIVHSSTATLDELPSGPGSMRQTAESRPVRSSTAIWGKSKWGGRDTWGSEEDGNLWEEIKAVLFGHKTTPTEQDAFDAKHILTAVQGGMDFFVTQERNILNKSEYFQMKHGLTIVDPETCLRQVRLRLGASDKDGP